MAVTRSILFRAALTYLIITVLNITVFILLVFENQVDLISENAVLTSLSAGSSLKYSLDNLVRGKGGLDAGAFQKIAQAASQAGAGRLTIWSEDGRALYRSPTTSARVGTDRATATAEEFALLNAAIMKRDFEDKLFSQRIDKTARTIELFIPFSYSGDTTAVAAVTLEMKDIPRQMAYLYRQCVIMGLLILVLHSIFVIIVSRILILPLRSLLDATGRMSRGALDVSVPVRRDDEIGQLSRSFNEMSVALRRMREEAREANPLTGLPGNLAIARRIDERLRSGEIFAVLYCDLDNFKAYNDAYGFSKGDEAILYTRECLQKTFDQLEIADGFVGHEGGDDFIVIASFEAWEPYVHRFIALFDEGAPLLYSEGDRKNGFIESVDRKGRRQSFPLMTVSIAVVTNKWRSYDRHQEIAETAAEVKKLAKKSDGTPGSRFAIDRRMAEPRPDAGDPARAVSADGEPERK